MPKRRVAEQFCNGYERLDIAPAPDDVNSDVQPRSTSGDELLIARCAARLARREDLPFRTRGGALVETRKPRSQLPRAPVERNRRPPVAVDATRGPSKAITNAEVPRSVGIESVERHTGMCSSAHSSTDAALLTPGVIRI